MREQDLQKYLRRNPGSTVTGLEKYPCAVVIPSYDEVDEIRDVLDSLALAAKPLPAAVIVVANHPAGCSGSSTAKLLELLKQRNDPDLFPIFAPDLTGGVGEARKIGMDCFIRSKTIQTLEQSMIYSLDSDSPVAPDYFSATQTALAQHPAAPGILIDVRHRKSGDKEQDQAIRQYENYLFRYAEKLARAGSPYGFVSIGSGFAVRGASYVKAGGMRIRKAGEDFYFLQELAKQGTLCKTGKPLVFPSPRISERVPFGTGQAVKGLLRGTPLNEIPDSAFEHLAMLLAAAQAPDGFLSDPDQKVPGDCCNFFAAEKFPQVWRSIIRNTPPDHKARLQAFHRWFDGLKTLRFLHALQRRAQENTSGQ